LVGRDPSVIAGTRLAQGRVEDGKNNKGKNMSRLRKAHAGPQLAEPRAVNVQSVTIDDDLILVSMAMPEPPRTALSRAEHEVTRLALKGLSNAAIAGLRRSSARTVANQLAAAYRKLGVSSRRELQARHSLGRGAEP
jgi:DNA-binding CsgD family transcriptional regulator